MKPNTSGIKGVCWNKLINRWQVRLFLNKEPIYVGVYETLEQAKEASEVARKKHGVGR